MIILKILMWWTLVSVGLFGGIPVLGYFLRRLDALALNAAIRRWRAH
jgi:hypothetical protein